MEKVEENLGLDKLTFENLQILPRKSDIQVDIVALAWIPLTVDAAGIAEAAYRNGEMEKKVTLRWRSRIPRRTT